MEGSLTVREEKGGWIEAVDLQYGNIGIFASIAQKAPRFNYGTDR
jgi:hypothetical protein